MLYGVTFKFKSRSYVLTLDKAKYTIRKELSIHIWHLHRRCPAATFEFLKGTQYNEVT